MKLIAWLVLGLLAGALARFFVPGRVPLTWGETLLLGLAGSLVGGFLGDLLDGRRRGVRPAGLVGSVVGAVLVVLVARALS